MSGELYLPPKLVEELRADAERDVLARRDTPITFHDTTLRIGGLSASSGSPIPDRSLLSEIRGWTAIGLRPVIDRLGTLDLRAHVMDDSSEDDPELSMDHPANMILRNPNPFFTLSDMLGLMGAWLKIVGQGYWQVLHDGQGVPRELWPMPPDRVYPVPSETDVIKGFIVEGTNGETIPLEKREVIRVWRPDPLRMFQGAGDFAPQANVHNAETFRVSSIEEDFRHDSTPRLLFEASPNVQALTPEQREEFQVAWKELNHRRRGRGRGVPAVAPPGFTAHELARNADAAGTVQMGDAMKSQLLAAMGTPGSIVGLVEDVNRAAAETNQLVFDRHTIAPLARRIADALTHQLAPQFDAGIAYQFKPFESDDKAFTLAQEQSDLDRKVVTVNEIRERRGLPEAEWGELPIGSFADVPFDGGGQPALESPQDLGDAPRIIRQRADRMPSEVLARFEPTVVWKRMIANERRNTSRMQRAVGRIFEMQRRAVVDRLKELMPEPRTRVGAEDLFIASDFLALFRLELLPEQRRVLVENAQQTSLALNQDKPFIFTDEVDRVLERIHADTVTRVNQTTKDLITRALRDGQSAGEGVDGIAKRMNGAIMNRKRARTIARTEVGKGAQVAQRESFKQSGVVEGKRWNTSLDAAVRDSHQVLEGVQVPLEGVFKFSSGETADHPLDPQLSAGETVNCRCFLTPVFIDEGE